MCLIFYNIIFKKLFCLRFRTHDCRLLIRTTGPIVLHSIIDKTIFNHSRNKYYLLNRTVHKFVKPDLPKYGTDSSTRMPTLLIITLYTYVI